MTGQAHWIVMIPIVLGAAAIAWLFWRDVVEAKRYRADDRRFLCPVQRRRVSATLVRDVSSNSVIGVRSCSGFASGANCGRACVPSFGGKNVARRTAAA
jgi:hypothetical protein